MKRFLGAASLLFVLAGCGGAGSGGGDITVTSLVSKVEQDLVCCNYWDDENNTCAELAIPATRSVEISLREALAEEEFGETGDLIFESCSARFVPNPSLPEEAKDPELLEVMNSYLFCTATDVPADGTGAIKITYSQGLLDELFQVWQNYGGTFNYTIEVTVRYKKDDADYIKVIKIPIDFGNFVFAEHDMCVSE